MRILLDTHAFLWAASGSPRLSEPARQHFLEPANQVFLSLASVWEMAIKSSLGKLQLGLPLSKLIKDALQRHGLSLATIEFEHVLLVQRLPFHHRDPFDRLLVAQAMVEGFALLSIDSALDSYDITRIW